MVQFFLSEQPGTLEDYASFLANSPIGIYEWQRLGTQLQHKYRVVSFLMVQLIGKNMRRMWFIWI